WVLLMILVLGFGSASAPPRAYACFCMPGSAHRALASSDVVFYGKVVSVSGTSDALDWSGPGAAAMVFDVVTTWKGSPQSRRVCYAPNGDCGKSFAVGREVVVFAQESAEGLVTNLCSYYRPQGA